MDEKEFEFLKTVIKRKSLSFKLKGESMMPLLENGTDITISSVKDMKDLKPFDVIAFFDTTKKILICHYYIKKNIINGDLNTKPLNPLKGDDVPFPPRFLLGIVKNIKIGFFLKLRIFLKHLF